MIDDAQSKSSADLPAARIVKAVGGQYHLDNGVDFHGVATARGLLRLERVAPRPGDLVQYEESGDPDAPWRIRSILPRRNLLVRPPLANLDMLLITIAATEPVADFYLVDKLIAVCHVNDIQPVLIVTKTDLIDGPIAQSIYKNYEACNVEIILSSPTDEQAHERLRTLLRGRVVSFAGQSGVGKSTLLNQLFGDEKMLTGTISDRIGRGKHTTRHVELFRFAGGFLADTPGFSTLDLVDLGLTSDTIVQGYPEIEAVSEQCRFTGCRHLGELGCAVTMETILPDRLERYRQFRRQLDLVKPYEQMSRRTGGSQKKQ